MEYNTARPPLQITEYGRNVQKMLEKALQIEDRAERTAMAKIIVDVMSQINPQAKETLDYKHKLWDHLFMMSEFKLDVDAPYPMPEQKQEVAPQKLSYPSGKADFPHYGNYIKKIVLEVTEMDDDVDKDLLVEQIAHYLKRSYLLWNRDSVDDDLIYENFASMSEGKLKLKETFRLKHTQEILNTKTAKKNHPTTNRPHKKNGTHPRANNGFKNKKNQ